jgi:RNA polymerase sigma factor (sigma-70 family)
MAVNIPATWLLANYNKIKVPRGYRTEVWKEAKQEAFIKLFKTCYEVDSKSVVQYVNRSIINIYTTLTKKSKREVSDDILENFPQEITDNYMQQNSKAFNKVRSLIESLPPKQKEAMKMYLSSKNLKSSSDKIGSNSNTNKKNYREGLIKIKNEMKGIRWD